MGSKYQPQQSWQIWNVLALLVGTCIQAAACDGGMLTFALNCLAANAVHTVLRAKEQFATGLTP